MSINSYENFYVYVEHIVLHHSAVEAGGLRLVDEKGWHRGDSTPERGVGGRVIPCPQGTVVVPAPASPPRIWRESEKQSTNQGTTIIVAQASLRLSQIIPQSPVRRISFRWQLKRKRAAGCP